MNSNSGVKLSGLFRLMAAGWFGLACVACLSPMIPILPELTWSGLTYAVLVVLFSCLAFGMYGLDKLKAQRGWWRISEKALHVVAVLGGWPGATWGQHVFRHKTQKTSFRLVFWATLGAHFAILCILVYTGLLAPFPRTA